MGTKFSWFTKEEKQKIRELRKEGMTYKEIATRFGRSKTAIGRVCSERGAAPEIERDTGKEKETPAKKKKAEPRPLPKAGLRTPYNQVSGRYISRY